MAFNSIDYLVFLTVAFLVHWALPQRIKMFWLWALSYFFYAQWNEKYLILIALSTLVDYGCALGMERKPLRAKVYLIISLLSNLGILFTFKYLGFFSEVAQQLGELLGRPLYVPILEVLLPVGISFYTLQTLSYSIDVYNKKIKPEHSFPHFATYVSFFPQLVAGPIERAGHILPQLNRRPSLNIECFNSGLRLILWGLVKKTVLADRIAPHMEYVYHQHHDPDNGTVLFASILANILIYVDFSAYSDIAIGSARLLGYQLRVNFNFPLFSRSMPDFWKRWHTSLHDFFIDYIYYPIGGRRVNWSRWLFNIFVIFIISGLWHGAAWNFVAWSIFHMLLVWVHIHLAKLWQLQGWAMPSSPWHALWQIPLVHLQRALSMIFFFIPNPSRAWELFRNLFTENYSFQIGTLLPYPSFVQALILLGPILLMILEGLHIRRSWGQRLKTMPLPFNWTLHYALILSIAILGVETNNPFIYFQF